MPQARDEPCRPFYSVFYPCNTRAIYNGSNDDWSLDHKSITLRSHVWEDKEIRIRNCTWIARCFTKFNGEFETDDILVSEKQESMI